jgi:DNA repair exonuclease SbcCD nuclease subunit
MKKKRQISFCSANDIAESYDQNNVTPKRKKQTLIIFRNINMIIQIIVYGPHNNHDNISKK